MKAWVLSAALILAASPGLASSGRIACQIEVRDLAGAVEAQFRGRPVPRELTEQIQAANNQCRFASGLAQANVDGLRHQWGLTGDGDRPAVAGLGDESLDAYDYD